MSHRPFRLVVIAAARACRGSSVLVPSAASRGESDGHHPPARTVDVQVLAINDFHGNLEPPGGMRSAAPSGGRGVSRHAASASSSDRRAQQRGGVRGRHHRGQAAPVGPVPRRADHRGDEPVGLELAAVGNHEFDEGADELLRMQAGGCHPVDGCQDGDHFEGADFQYLAANVIDEAPGSRSSRPTRSRVSRASRWLHRHDPRGHPEIVTPSGVAGLAFLDEADTVNALVPRLKRGGVHRRAAPRGRHTTGGENDCPGVSGPIVDIVPRLDQEMDAVLCGHTHRGTTARGRTPPATRSW